MNRALMGTTMIRTRTRLGALLVATFAVACLDLSPEGKRFACPACPGDSGEGREDGGDAGADGSVPPDSGDAGMDASVSPDGGGMDGSVKDGGPPDPVLDGGWQFQPVTPDFGANSGGKVLSITTRPGQVLAAQRDGRLLFRTDGTWTLLEQFGNPGTFLDGAALAPDGTVLLFTSRYAGVCKADCTNGASYTWTPVLATNEQIYGLCGTSSGNMFAVGTRSNTYGILYRYDGNGWTELSNDLGLYDPVSCAVDAAGVLWVFGGSKVIRSPETDAGVTELLDGGADAGTLNPSAMQLWYGTGAAQGWVHAVGLEGRLASRSPTGEWLMFKRPGASPGTLMAVGSAGDATFAGGYLNSVEQTFLWEFRNPTWIKRAPVTPLTNITAIGSTGPNELFFGGNVGTTRAALVRGVR